MLVVVCCAVLLCAHLLLVQQHGRLMSGGARTWVQQHLQALVPLCICNIAHYCV